MGVRNAFGALPRSTWIPFLCDPWLWFVSTSSSSCLWLSLGETHALGLRSLKRQVPGNVCPHRAALNNQRLEGPLHLPLLGTTQVWLTLLSPPVASDRRPLGGVLPGFAGLLDQNSPTLSCLPSYWFFLGIPLRDPLHTSPASGKLNLRAATLFVLYASLSLEPLERNQSTREDTKVLFA